MCAIWISILGMKLVGLYNNFVEEEDFSLIFLSVDNDNSVHLECANHTCCHRGRRMRYTYLCSKDRQYIARGNDNMRGKVSAILPTVMHF